MTKPEGVIGSKSAYKQFNKWTLTSGSPELADENVHAMWWGMNMNYQVPPLSSSIFFSLLVCFRGTRDTRRRNLSSSGVCGRDQLRNTSYKEFMLVGPTGCKSGDTVNVTRKWVSAPYVGDDAVLPFSSQPPA